MQFRFDANQEYQLHAIEAVTDLLDGQPPIGMDVTLELGSPTTPVWHHSNSMKRHAVFGALTIAAPQRVELVMAVHKGASSSKFTAQPTGIRQAPPPMRRAQIATSNTAIHREWST